MGEHQPILGEGKPHTQVGGLGYEQRTAVAVGGWLFVKHGPGELHGQRGDGLGRQCSGGLVAAHVFPVEACASRQHIAQVRGYPIAGEVAAPFFRQQLVAKSVPHLLQKRVGCQRGQPVLASGFVHQRQDLVTSERQRVGAGRKKHKGEQAVVGLPRTTMIRFGTAGWRGVVGQDFTFRQVRRLLWALSRLLPKTDPPQPVLVAYDTRLLSEKLAQEAVDVFTHFGFPTVLADRDLPAPALAWAVRQRPGLLGVMFTASHNPPEYNGVKLYTKDGVLAGREFTDRVEREVEHLASQPEPFFLRREELVRVEPLGEAYLAALEAHVDWDAVRRIPGKVVVDPLFGTAREFLDRLLLAHGVPTRVLHATKDPYFGGYAPECTPANLATLREAVREEGAILGLATDGDADRFGVVDGSCRVLPPNPVLAALVDYLTGSRRLGAGPGGVGRTVATTRLVDRIAAARGLELLETPVGFPSLGPLLLSGRVCVGVEESAGLGVSAHLPERDGIFACLLLAEMVGATGLPLRALLRNLFGRYGTLLSRRVQLPLREESPRALELLRGRQFREFAGLAVTRVEREGGVLLELAGGAWVLWRLSGTEPKVRLYAEAPTTNLLRVLVREAKKTWRKAEEEVRHV